ncbi:unnamed protein product [Chrysodeixis includens]|uniref:Protein HIRA n=1 Tax=Chrysodeixis includens TaxID=689277 RepID=A0A9N8KV16_CHRIL|nr:unnamed protein product [Chrysodeixis includens]
MVNIHKPIFSVDIHPTGKRFATGGQGGDSGRVVVWNLNPVLFEAVEVDPNIPKMLCQMDNHFACVNCVRWSNGGKYLASGGDDRLVMVWGLSVAAIGTPGKHKAETWRCLATLRGHAGDVLDLAWSPLDKWLASCSVDNTIIIWNAEKFPEMVCVLNGHTGLVKGVAWDPVGKYLASQSDDKSLRVWKTADWAQEVIITEPFEECGGTTHVLRLSWSPDGQYVLSAHAMNGGGPTAQVVERDGWRCDKDFVGHRKAVTCARFNNNIFVKEGRKYCCAAVGSRDRALSIWLTSLKRPLVVVHDLFSDSVLDLSWSSDGLNLLACSSDGTVACIQFTNKEIGTPLTLEEKNSFYEKIYGKCLANESGGDLSANLLVECPEILLARERQDAKKEAAKEETTPKSEKSQSKILLSPSSASCGPSSTPLRPMDRQIETRTSDGKRRITPVFIPLTHADANNTDRQIEPRTSDGKRRITPVFIPLTHADANDTDRQIETRTSDGKRRITPVFIPLTHADANNTDRQIETRTSDGKRRITPVFIPLTHADANNTDRQIETRTSDGKRRITPVFIPLTHADANNTDRQIETRTSDGKRRITPVFIPLTHADANNTDRQIETRTSAGKRRITPVFIPLTHADANNTDRQIETRTSDGKRRITPVFIPLTHADANNTDRQIETRTSDGKRRITPVFIPLTHADANESLGSQPGGSENCFSTSSQSKSRIKVEVRDDIVIHPNVSNHATSTHNNSRTSDNSVRGGLDARLRKQGGRALPGPRAEELAGAGREGRARAGASRPRHAPCRAALGTAGPSCAPPACCAYRYIYIAGGRGAGGARPARLPAPPRAALPAPARHRRARRARRAAPTAGGRGAGARRASASRPAPRAPALPAPALGTAGPVVRAAGLLRLQVVNKAFNTQYGTLARLQLLPNNSASTDPVWETYLALMSQAAKLTLSGDTLAVVTTSAELAMWELASAACVIRPLCFRALLTHGVTVTNCSLMDDGNPMISLSNGKSYIYSKQLCVWVVWTDASDPLWRSSGGARHTRHARHAPLARPAHNNNSTYSSGAARSWLEAQVASCLHLKLAKEYRHWITTLFSHLVNHGNEEQLRSILDDMLGPSHCTSTPKKWQSTILGIRKHELLEEMLALLVRQLRWQRLYGEYCDQLNDIKTSGALLNGH